MQSSERILSCLKSCCPGARPERRGILIPPPAPRPTQTGQNGLRRNAERGIREAIFRARGRSDRKPTQAAVLLVAGRLPGATGPAARQPRAAPSRLSIPARSCGPFARALSAGWSSPRDVCTMPCARSSCRFAGAGPERSDRDRVLRPSPPRFVFSIMVDLLPRSGRMPPRGSTCAILTSAAARAARCRRRPGGRHARRSPPR